jgi:hypothetical protein
MAPQELGFTARIVKLFIQSRLSPLILIASLLMGLAALLFTPREEEPQIVVPVMDVFVEAPGIPADEVEKLVATPLEHKLWEIPGVEYVYSLSMPGRAHRYSALLRRRGPRGQLAQNLEQADVQPRYDSTLCDLVDG